MEARLSAQDRIIDTLATYTTAQVTEHLAKAIYDGRQTTADAGRGSDEGPAPTRWDQLADPAKESTRAQARRVGERLAAIGCLMVPTFDPANSFVFTDDEVNRLAMREHEHQTAAAAGAAMVPGPRPQPGALPDRRVGHEPDVAPDPVTWNQLSDHDRAAKLEEVRRIPEILDSVGFQVVRQNTGDGAHEADFTPDEWATVQQALMASGVLVSLAEGTVDPGEIFALVKALREAGTSHPNRFIRELAAASTFDTGIRAGTEYADYKTPALQLIRTATMIIARTAPRELPDFRELLVQLAMIVADANNEGGFFGLGARPRTPSEAAAIHAIQKTTELAGVAALGTNELAVVGGH
jgi:hypothetical protein